MLKLQKEIFHSPTTLQLKVVHIVSTLNIGGLEMVVVKLAQHCDRSRFQLHVICLGELGPLAEQVQGCGVTVESMGGGGSFRGSLTLRLIRRLRQLRPDVVHTHNPDPHLHGALSALFARVPALVHTKHGRNILDCRHSVRVNRFASWLSDRVVPVSDDAAAVARDMEHVPLQKLTVIRNGVDLAGFHFVARPPVERALHAITVARLNRIKDQKTMLRAMRLVVDAEPLAHLDIVGDGPERADLEALVAELNLQQSVTFHGFRSDIQELLATADFFVLSSVSEGVSLTLLEAMATGLPLVATAVGGNPEVVADGETGLLVPAQSPVDFAQAMLTMIRNPTATRAMGEASRRRVEAEFDLRSVVRRYEAIYCELLGRPAG